ncbi:hypothetical protein [Hyphomonas sp.]|uniref:HD domain-containing protein n=1 Tax=Hyphomonas sp. TaxID=87 RepID=UPI0032D93155
MIPACLLEGLRTRYAEPQRHYHDWAHVETLLEYFRRREDQFHRPEPVLWALYWHDAVYDPLAQDNEEQSAQLLERDAAGHLTPEDAAFAAMMIRATADHVVPPGLNTQDTADLGLFLDLDLSILGAPAPVYDRYERAIRAEMAAVPADAFRAARGAILKGLLSRERLYFTPRAHREWEDTARANLERAIAVLEQGP